MREVEGNERAAYRSLFAAGQAVHGPRCFEVADLGEAALFMSPLVRQPGVFNRVLGFGLDASADLRDLARMEAAFASRGLGMGLEASPAQLSPAVSARLRELGLRRGAMSAMLIRRHGWGAGAFDAPAAWRPERGGTGRLRAVQADSAGQRAMVAAICARVFAVGDAIGRVLEALPAAGGWQHWLAYLDEEPAGAALSHVADGRCWLGWAATLREFRSLGVKGALDDLRLAHAAASGCRLVSSDTAVGTTASPDHSLKSLRRRGFEVLYQRATYLRLAPLHAPHA
ncbi:MAG: hypothetical protein JNJ89_06345 [Rubrivivax sp.]|nr:hypothetical protein [Rubrivivax sp.]